MDQKHLVEDLLKYWKENKIFEQSVASRSSKLAAMTYDGPPFASGSPHFGHGLVGVMKDLIGRHKTMNGYQVVRDRGWDCHGLPVEKFVEKKLGLDGKRDIEENLGVEKFTEECRAAVHNVNSEWSWFVDHIGRWADMDHAYFTMDLDFMESVIWVFSEMYNKNLIYKGFKIQGYCPSCATTLSNSEINEGYMDRQDPAITVKFPLNANKKQVETNSKIENATDGSSKATRCIIKNSEGKLLMSFMPKYNEYLFPGGKIDKGETAEQATIREVKEETGIELPSVSLVGQNKCLYKTGLWNEYYFEATTDQQAQNIEPEHQSEWKWISIEESDNEFGWAINIEGTIIDNIDEIIRQFHDLYSYQNNIVKHINELDSDIENKPINVLAWTTTPWTLPSNSFLAVGKHVSYVQIFDKDSKEYYVIARDLLKSYYKNPDEYILVNVLDGEHLVGFNYEPLFDYINKSEISSEYLEKYFQIIAGDFVTTDSGTGIVHLAPAFGQDDFEAVANILPREKAQDWLFLPVNDYGEFNEQVPEYQNIRVYDANKDIIKELKDKGKFIAQTSYNHSYPHCWRCKTPLIYRAITSWFVKEPELAKQTVENAKKIHFVPESIKNRFIDVLGSAPDWNISRNRYWGSPLPVWVNEVNEDKIVIGNLDELYQHSITGSKNITKNIFIRHGRTDFNDKHLGDSFGKAVLTELGKQQAIAAKNKLNEHKLDKEDTIIVISPLIRCWETILPYLQEHYSDELANIETKYQEVVTKYQDLRNQGKFINFVQANKDTLFEIGNNIYVDFRIAELHIPEVEDIEFDCRRTQSIPVNEKLYPNAETIQQMHDRTSNYIEDINQKFKTKTIITVSHGDPLVAMQNKYRNFDYRAKKYDYYMKNGGVIIHYRDNYRKMEVDLHKPYIDNYWFNKDGVEYKRIPEVLDCWFESGSMPYGQSGYIGKDIQKGSKKPFQYPADYIIEGLDQTRGWFRTLHVLGNGIMGDNSFKNVMINGLILAEDGKKMSKSLNNYPDPKYLFDRYGTDAYRLYLLASPAVKAEPVRFTEKGVDQVYKDFTASLTNAYKFFETYAKVDNFTMDGTNIHFIRHAQAEGTADDAKITDEGMLGFQNPEFVKSVLRINADVIYTDNILRAHNTALEIAKVIKEYTGKDIEVKVDEKLGLAYQNGEILANYQEKIINQEKGKNVLIIAHNETFKSLWKQLYNTQNIPSLDNLEAIELPTYVITNDLDKWILASLNDLAIKVQDSMNKYYLDEATKSVLGFIDKLTNWYIRRSRRRFRSSGMSIDKLSAYHTLHKVLEHYTRITASFAPFISEYIWRELQQFCSCRQPDCYQSVHLQYYPVYNEKYIDKNLMEEISIVRKIISLGLFIRSKTKIKIKQPLSKMEIKID